MSRLWKWMGAVWDWSLDLNPLQGTLFITGVTIMGTAILVGVITTPIIIFSDWQDKAHPCIAYDAPHYHAPIYVMMGKMIVPVGGGTYSDCVKRK